MNIRSIVSNAAHSIANEATCFGKDLGRLVSRDSTLKTRLMVITEIAGLAIAVYGAVSIGLGIAACATGVGAPAGLWLIAKGGITLATGWDLYKIASNALKIMSNPDYRSREDLRNELYENTSQSALRSLFGRCAGCFRRT